jgi:biotin carboxyl carrier protein
VSQDDAGAAERIEPERTTAERLADHATIDRLADELLPALVAKLGASGLGELDVREDAWRVRLRMPADARGSRRTPSGGRAGRMEPHAAPSGHLGAVAAAGIPGAGAMGAATPGAATPGAATLPAPADAGDDIAQSDPPTRAMATSPAVGFFRPRVDLPSGARVRAGDRLAMIDVLGVPQELVAPVDGLVGATFVEAGDPVEYGQEVIEIQLLAEPTATSGAASTATSGAGAASTATSGAGALPAAASDAGATAASTPAAPSGEAG